MKTPADALLARLWTALDSLRGAVSHPEALIYLLALLYLKRTFGSATAPPRSRPKSTSAPDWNSIRVLAPGQQAEAVRRALELAEKHDDRVPTGLLTELDFSRWGLGGDASLHSVLEVLSGLPDDLDPDALALAIDMLLERVAVHGGRRDASFVTPADLGELLVRLVNPRPGEQISDPACGAGLVLLKCFERASRCELAGQEINRSIWRLAGLNFLLHGVPASSLAWGDALRAPRLLDGERLRTFDAVVSDPPYSLSNWGREQAEFDPFQRFAYGLPPAGNGDMAWIQHAVATLKTTGRAVLVVAPGVLFREGVEAQIRGNLIKDDVVEASISLGPNLVYGTAVPLAILMLTRKKSAARRGKVLIVDATKAFTAARGKNKLSASDVEAIANVVLSFKDSKGTVSARVVDGEELAANNYSLHVPRYLRVETSEEKVDLAALRAQVRELETSRARAVEDMDRLLEQVNARRRERT